MGSRKMFINHIVPLPSATKLRRLCFYRCVSVHRGHAWSEGLPGHGWWCLVPGGAWSQGVPGPGGVGIPACTEADPPGETATAADGTHPNGMHSCIKMCVIDNINILSLRLPSCPTFFKLNLIELPFLIKQEMICND